MAFWRTFELTAATITVGEKFVSCIILQNNNRAFSSLLGATVRVEVCKIDLTTVDVQTFQRLAPLFM